MAVEAPKITPKIGLALGGGGARGLAHIGVLKVIERAGIHVDMLAGTSMGGLIGSMYAAGLPIPEIESGIVELASVKRLSKLVDFSLAGRGLLKGVRVYDLLADTLGADLTFADLQRPLAMVATDTRSNREIVIHEGKVIDAVRATISVPGFFVPVEYNHMSLVDGGMVNNVPVDVVFGMGADLVIAVDVMPNFSQNEPGKIPKEVMIDLKGVPGVLHETFNMIYLMMAVITDLKMAANPPHLLIRPSLPADIGVLLGFDRALEVIDLGEKAAINAYNQLIDLLN